MAKVVKESAKLIYEEAKSASQAVEEALTDYRKNAATTLALATGAATFFGFADSGKGFFYGAALVCYGLGVLAALAILRPRKWYFNFARTGARDLVGRGKQVPASHIYLELAIQHQRAVAENGSKIQGALGMKNRYTALIVFTAAVVTFGGVNVATNLGVNTPTQIEIVE